MTYQPTRLVDRATPYQTNGRAKRRICPRCGQRAGVLRRCFTEHFNSAGRRCPNSGQQVTL